MMQPKSPSKLYRYLIIPIAFLFIVSFTKCAKKGNPSGGVLDSIPPVIVRMSPENFTTNFKQQEFRIQFDEFIRLKDLSKELLISPPLKYAPIITPTNVSKQLRVKILDTLRENTTYSFNFGNSIIDNNEGNVFKNFKYVFSTGSFIDSLTLKGTVKDALLAAPQNPSIVMLYEINEAYTDSIIFTEKPNYVTPTIGETEAFEFTNLKEGTYQLIALKETSANYTFQPNTDKIAFYSSPISLPTNEEFTLKLFKEIPDYKSFRPKLESKNRISFSYEGNADSLTIEILGERPNDLEYILLKDRERDTINFWFKPAITSDSLQFIMKNGRVRDTSTIKFRELYKDSLVVSPINTNAVSIKDTLKLRANTPLVAINNDKITVVNKDTIAIPFQTKLDTINNEAAIIYDKTEEQRYTVNLMEGALIDFFDATNDSLEYKQIIKPASDFATLQLNLANATNFPLIVALVNDAFKVQRTAFLQENNPIIFDYLPPGNYFIRVVEDQNKNGQWDTGNFLSKQAPENVIYYPSIIELRPNWSWNETFTLE